MTKRGIIEQVHKNLTTIRCEDALYLSKENLDASKIGLSCIVEYEINERYVKIINIENETNTEPTRLKIINNVDFELFKDFLFRKIEAVKSTENETLIHSLEFSDLSAAFTNLQTSLKFNEINNGNYQFNCDQINSILEEVEDLQSNHKPTYNSEYYWGSWRINDGSEIDSGYDNNHFIKSYIQPHSSERKNVYNSPPPKLIWPLIRINQKGKTFYVSKGKIQEISQTSYVPHLPPNLSSEESAKRILDINRGDDQWQRNADEVRINRIKQFMDIDDNLITNTPMLFLSNSNAVKINEHNLEIDFSKFLFYEKESSTYSDRVSLHEDSMGNMIYQDFRPFWIIDGQHRIHGGNLSERKEEEIGIILFDNEFNLQETAKIFAEINTLQKKLSPLHEIFMQHRFKLRHTNSKRTFRDYRSESFEIANRNNWKHEWLNSRANTLSYEVAALLSSEGALYNLIQFLPQNTDSYYLYSADQWIIYANRWFSENSIYSNQFENEIAQNTGETNFLQYVFSEVNEFFNALDETFSSKNYTDKKSRWISTTVASKRPLISKKANFAMLLELYPTIRRIAKMNNIRNYNSEYKINQDSFMKALSPIRNVDWLDSDLNNLYSGGGERPRRSLQAWLSDALQNGKVYSRDEIHTDEIYSSPGKGILAKLAPPEVNLNDNTFPQNKEYIRLTSKRPYNARYEARITIYNEIKEEILSTKLSHPSLELNSTKSILIKTNSAVKAAQELTIRVEYTNIHTTNSGYSEIKIKVK